MNKSRITVLNDVGVVLMIFNTLNAAREYCISDCLEKPDTLLFVKVGEKISEVWINRLTLIVCTTVPQKEVLGLTDKNIAYIVYTDKDIDPSGVLCVRDSKKSSTQKVYTAMSHGTEVLNRDSFLSVCKDFEAHIYGDKA